MESMIKLMRYNNYTSDPLSRCDCSPPYSGENAISARNDLNPRNGTYPFHALSHRYQLRQGMERIFSIFIIKIPDNSLSRKFSYK